MKTWLLYGLITGAAGQLAIATLNLRIPRLLHWGHDLAAMPLLLREVFQVHVWFITATLVIFGAFTLRFAPDLAAGSSPLGRWMAVSMGTFWLIRTVLQVTYYSSSHWRGLPSRTVIHVVLLCAYGALATVYLTAGLR